MVDQKLETVVEDVCSEYDVIAVYLYGSFARDEHHEDSDIDVAVLFEDYSISKLLEVGRKLQEKLDTGRELDVRAINSAGLIFQFEVLKDGKVVYESDKTKRADFEQSVARRYHDMKPFVEDYRAEMRKRLVKSG